MSVALQLILTTALVAAPANCSWAHPGANPYRGNPVRALGDFGLPPGTREKLRALMAAHAYTDVVAISRDGIVGAHDYADLREMHGGGGRVCHGEVDRSAWSATHRERGLVYCADDACVVVPTICNNVSLVTRKPEREAALDETPIDISPAAGPPSPPADQPTTTPTDASPPIAFIPTSESGSPDSPGGGALGGYPVGGVPVGGGGGEPIGLPGGGLPCCDTGPIPPGGPGSPGTPPVSAIPKLPTAWLLLAGLATLAALRARRR